MRRALLLLPFGRAVAPVGGKTPTPDKVQGVANAVVLSAGLGTACVIEHPPVNGPDVVKCWGNNSNGQLGAGITGGTNPVPQVVKLPN